MYNQVKMYRLVHLVNGVSQQVTEIRKLLDMKALFVHHYRDTALIWQFYHLWISYFLIYQNAFNEMWNVLEFFRALVAKGTPRRNHSFLSAFQTSQVLYFSMNPTADIQTNRIICMLHFRNCYFKVLQGEIPSAKARWEHTHLF